MNDSRLFPRFRGIAPIRAQRGEGSFVIADDGRRYLDACGGAAISCLGHSEHRVSDAIAQQARTLAFAHPTFYTTDASEALAKELSEGAPGSLHYVLFGCGGSEQIDGTLKLARQYFVERGEPERKHFISRRHGFHGNTIGSLGMGGHVARRQPYLPMLVNGIHVSPCYAYRHQGANETDAEYAGRLAEELDQTIRAVGPETIIGFVAETISGAALGAVPPVPGYFANIREVCDRHGILLILDEVMCGMGRCGTRFACEQEGIAPDLLVVAKGLGSGYQPISATLVAKEIVETIMGGSGFFQHGHSYMAHPVACAAALEVQRVIRSDRLLDNVNRAGKSLHDAMVARFGGHEHVGDIRGRGLLWGIELVEQRETKKPFDPASRLWLKVLMAGLDHGLMCYPTGGTADGIAGDHILIAPPFNISEAEVGMLVDRLELALHDGLQRVNTPIEQCLPASRWSAA